MLCTRYLQRANIDATPDPPSLSIKLCSRTSKSLSLWGCWRPLFHVFYRQLLGNKLSFALCSMHILFDSNKFHKFWMSCVCRNPMSKDGRNQRKSRPPGIFRADRPDTSTYMGLIILLEQCDMFIRFQNKENISYSVGGPGRHKDQLKSPPASAKIVKWGNHPFQK